MPTAAAASQPNITPVEYTAAMITIAPMSSTIANPSKKARSDDGTLLPATASTPNSERDVGGHRDGPPAWCRGAGDREIDQRRSHHAAERGCGRQQRGAPRREVSVGELALDLQPDDEKEDGHQPVVDPMPQVEVQCVAGDEKAARPFQRSS